MFIYNNNTQPNKKNNTSKNLICIIILLLFFNKYKQYNISNVVYSIFQMPIKKKSVIFLRAPYKNKLARLNILKLEFTTVLSIKYTTKVITNKIHILYNLNKYNFSSHKLKQVKTKVSFYTKAQKNFELTCFI